MKIGTFNINCQQAISESTGLARQSQASVVCLQPLKAEQSASPALALLDYEAT